MSPISSDRKPLFSRNRKAWHPAILLTFLSLLPFPNVKASLIVNEVVNTNSSNQEWIEFLVTTDITLGALDSIWFGDTNSTTSTIDNSSRFDSTEIINNFAYFTSTSDIVRAGTIIVVGGTQIATDFTYNPSSNNPGDNGSWNFTLANGLGFNTTRPVNLSSTSDAIWISSGQPAGNTDTSKFISALAYLNSTSATGGGAVADFITTKSSTDPAFQTVHKGTGGGYDGNLANNRTLSNLSGPSINFGNSESVGSRGIPNGGANTTYIESLRAVPEPRAMVPLALFIAGGIFFLRKKSRSPATA